MNRCQALVSSQSLARQINAYGGIDMSKRVLILIAISTVVAVAAGLWATGEVLARGVATAKSGKLTLETPRITRSAVAKLVKLD